MARNDDSTGVKIARDNPSNGGDREPARWNASSP